jgi:hypothetical protein
MKKVMRIFLVCCVTGHTQTPFDRKMLLRRNAALVVSGTRSVFLSSQAKSLHDRQHSSHYPSTVWVDENDLTWISQQGVARLKDGEQAFLAHAIPARITVFNMTQMANRSGDAGEFGLPLPTSASDGHFSVATKRRYTGKMASELDQRVVLGGFDHPMGLHRWWVTPAEARRRGWSHAAGQSPSAVVQPMPRRVYNAAQFDATSRIERYPYNAASGVPFQPGQTAPLIAWLDASLPREQHVVGAFWIESDATAMGLVPTPEASWVTIPTARAAALAATPEDDYDLFHVLDIENSTVILRGVEGPSVGDHVYALSRRPVHGRAKEAMDAHLAAQGRADAPKCWVSRRDVRQRGLVVMDGAKHFSWSVLRPGGPSGDTIRVIHVSQFTDPKRAMNLFGQMSK